MAGTGRGSTRRRCRKARKGGARDHITGSKQPGQIYHRFTPQFACMLAYCVCEQKLTGAKKESCGGKHSRRAVRSLSRGLCTEPISAVILRHRAASPLFEVTTTCIILALCSCEGPEQLWLLLVLPLKPPHCGLCFDAADSCPRQSNLHAV